ncbi:MAG: glutamate racemase [Comamonas sp.]|nr:glutamate racemase [Comamonas sp.]
MQAVPAAPIGIFDSGIGGLSVLQALRAALPHERFVYVADSGYAPYGERGADFVRQRSQAITEYLLQAHGIKLLVVACNTATAAAITHLRALWPQLLLVGVEPAIKPAAALTRTGCVGVMATRGTVTSARFESLLHTFGAGVRWQVQACDGLARAIEASTWQADGNAAEIEALCARHTGALGDFGQNSGQIDTLVLGCTHYVFAQPVLQRLLGPQVQLLDTGKAVAQQTQRLLQQTQLLASTMQEAPPCPVQLFTTGALPALQAAAARWLHLPGPCCSVAQALL